MFFGFFVFFCFTLWALSHQDSQGYLGWLDGECREMSILVRFHTALKWIKQRAQFHAVTITARLGQHCPKWQKATWYYHRLSINFFTEEYSIQLIFRISQFSAFVTSCVKWVGAIKFRIRISLKINVVCEVQDEIHSPRSLYSFRIITSNFKR